LQIGITLFFLYDISLVIEQVKYEMESVKKFFLALTSGERWGVMVQMKKNQPQMFGQLLGRGSRLGRMDGVIS
jgi:hypothetical protein